MPRLLATPALRAVREPLTPGAVQLPAHLRKVVDDARSAAYDEGFQAGTAAATARQVAEVEEVVAALRDAVTTQSGLVDALRRAHDNELLSAATAIAAYVLDAIDTTSVDDVIARITAAIDGIDDIDLVAHVAPAQVDAIAAALAGVRVEVVADERIEAGDARVVGRWSIAELSAQHRWDAVRGLLDAS